MSISFIYIFNSSYISFCICSEVTPCLQSFASRCPSTTCSQNSSFHIKWPWHPGENQLTVNIGVHFKTFNFTALIHMVLIMPNHSVLFIISFQIVKYDSYFSFSQVCVNLIPICLWHCMALYWHTPID